MSARSRTSASLKPRPPAARKARGAGSSSSPSAPSSDLPIPFPLPINHQFAVPAETRGFEDHTGFLKHEGEALKRLQERFLPFWDARVKANGMFDVPTKNAVIRVQHHARYEMSGRLDEKTWTYIQRMRP